MPTLRIPYRPQSYQQDVHRSTRRYRVLDIGRRGGKTELALNELIKRSIQLPGLYWYVAPSYRQAKAISWVRLKALFREFGGHVRYNEQELSVEIFGRGKIELKGADNEDSLLGVGLRGVVFDEAAMIKSNVWPRIIRPMLADSRGWAIFISTPRGRNWFYDLYLRGLDEAQEDWQSWHYPTSVNQYIPTDEIDEMRRDMPDLLFRQEVLAEFVDETTGVFKGIKRCIAGYPEDPVDGRMYYMGVDLAKTYDFTVLTVVDGVSRQVVACERFNDLEWSIQKLKIQDLAARYNNALCVVDSTGLGDPVVDDLRKSGVGVDTYQFTHTSKTNLVNNLSLAIEQRLITIPQSYEVMLDELSNYDYMLTPGGKITYGAPEGKHDDCVISLALAVWGIRNRLREAQVVQRQEVLLSAQDKQGLGEMVVEDEYDYDFAGY